MAITQLERFQQKYRVCQPRESFYALINLLFLQLILFLIFQAPIILFSLMKINSFRKQPSVVYPQSNPDVYHFVINDLEQTIDGHTYLGGKLNCRCDLCKQKLYGKEPLDGNLFRTNSKESAYWLKKILDGLCLSGARTLKFHLPDIIFLEGDNLEIFQTNRKDGRLIKLTNSISLKSMYPTAVRLRKEYKNILEETFNEKMLEQIDPQFMHVKYFDKFVPPFFHDGQNNHILQENKYQFKRYILHKNKKYEIQQIEEHKMNDKEPFCLVKYNDGNCQLFNQREFEVYSLSLPSRLQEELVYVQSYIKYKLETEAIYYSQYTLGPTSIDHEIDNRAEKETMVLIGGVTKFDAGYKDVQTYDELSHEMMVSSPRQYVNLMTYKIVHYLSMTSRIYIDHIKIKWIMNDIGNIYLQQVMEFQMSEIPKKLIKYRLPPKDETLQFYHENHRFVLMYKELKKRKNVNTHIIKKTIEGKSYEEIMQMIDPEARVDNRGICETYFDKNLLFVKSQKSRRICFPKNQENTVIVNGPTEKKSKRQKIEKQAKSFEKHLKNNPQLQQQNHKRHNSVNLDKWRNIGLIEKKERISKKIDSYFTINIPDQQITLANKALQVSNSNRYSKSSGKCRLRYALNDEEKTSSDDYRTLSTFKSFKRDKGSSTSKKISLQEGQ